ncbi:hypothetical protein GOV14_06315 [Candidatus Pacearchaeota archaeon]|nr:hypothetical protein [Candidatus Pacearchaeota archaeon]
MKSSKKNIESYLKGIESPSSKNILATDKLIISSGPLIIALPVIKIREEGVTAGSGKLSITRKYEDCLILKPDGTYLIGNKIVDDTQEFFKYHR